MAAEQPLLQRAFEGFPAGMNLAVAPQEIPNGMARYLQDVLVDNPGIARRRGQLVVASGIPTRSGRAVGIAQANTVSGGHRIAVLIRTASNLLEIHGLDSTYSTYATLSSNINFTVPDDRVIFDAKPALKSGTMIGLSQDYVGNVDSRVMYWRGSTRTQYSSVGDANNNFSTTRGSTVINNGGTVGIDCTTVIEPGMFVINVTTRSLIGVVAGVTSSNVTLEEKALADVLSSGQLISFVSIRSVVPLMMKGRITTSVGQATVIGAGTKFGQMKTGIWDIFRLEDKTYIGTITSITNDRFLTLTGNSAIDVSNERFIGVPRGGTVDWLNSPVPAVGFNGPGFLTTVYQGLQFYANNPDTPATAARIWFSDAGNPEGLDMGVDDGDFLNVTSQSNSNAPITAVVGLQNALAILKDEELFALFGNDPSNFQLRKIADVGTWSAMSVQQYQNTIIFASRNGVYQFDGVRLRELTAALGNEYKTGVKLNQDRAWSMIYHDHYIVHIKNYNQTYVMSKGDFDLNPPSMTICINLLSGAVTTMTNLCLRGSTTLPSRTGKGTWFLVNSATPTTFVCDAVDLWSTVGPDAIICEGERTGAPDFYIETKRYDMGDPARKSFFKHIIMSYISVGDTLTIDTVPGLGNIGTTTGSQFPVQEEWEAQRIKFLKRDTHMGFRIYESQGSASDIQIGPWALGYKWQRIGRV